LRDQQLPSPERRRRRIHDGCRERRTTVINVTLFSVTVNNVTLFDDKLSRDGVSDRNVDRAARFE
jgi:hypothetical protein